MKARLYWDRWSGWVWRSWSIQHLAPEQFTAMVDLCNQLDRLNPINPETRP